MKLRWSAALPAVLVLHWACVFKSDKEFVYPLQPPTGNGATINLNNVTEPIIINTVTSFSFSSTPSDNRGRHFEVTADGQTLVSVDTEQASWFFSIDPSQFDSSITLTIKVISHSSSGSLADQLDAEFLTFSRSWTINTDIVPPDPVPASQVFIEDGKSVIQWTVPSKQNFSQLVVVRTYDQSELQNVHDSLFVTDKTATRLHDDSYVGGGVHYQIVLKGYKFRVAGPETYFITDPFQVTYDSLSSPPVFHWTKPTLYGNAVTVQVLQGGYTQYSLVMVAPPTDAGSYTVSSMPVFGTYAVYSISLVSPQFEHRYSVKKTVVNGQKIPEFNFIEYVPSQHAYFLLRGNVLTRLDDHTLKVTGSLSFDSPSTENYGLNHIPISPNGQFAYLQKPTDPKTVVQVDLSSMSTLRSVDLRTYLPGPYQNFYPAPDMLQVTDDNLFYFLSGQEYIIDMNSNQVYWTVPSGPVHYMSPTGAFMVVRGTVYGRNGNDWSTVIGTYTLPTYGSIQFFEGVNNRLIMFEGSTAYVYDLDSGNGGPLHLISSSNITPFEYSFYDQFTNSFSGQTFHTLGNLFRVFELDSQQETKSIDVGYYDGTFLVRYINGRFFHQKGYTTLQ